MWRWGLLAIALAAPGSPDQLAVDAGGRLVPVQEHQPPPPPVLRKVEAVPIPTNWPTAQVPPQPEPRSPEQERQAQIAGWPSTRNAEAAQEASHGGTELLIGTSGAFLGPAVASGRKGMTWFSMLFASQALICGVYHYCDQHRVGTKLLGPSCSEPNYRFWHLADHGLAYFVMLQMALLLLGPEDPTLRRLSSNCQLRGLLQAVFATRICPALLILSILWRSARGDHAIGSPVFHLLLGALCCLMFLFAQGSFWLLRPSAAARALCMRQSWLRLLLCFFAVVASLLMFVGMQMVANDGTKVGMGGWKACAHSAWHVCTALLASGVFAFLDCACLRYDADDFEERVVKEF